MLLMRKEGETWSNLTCPTSQSFLKGSRTKKQISSQYACLSKGKTYGGGGFALLPPPVAACVAFNLLCISSHSFLCSLSRLKVLPRRAFSASAASLSRCGRTPIKTRNTTTTTKQKQTTTSANLVWDNGPFELVSHAPYDSGRVSKDYRTGSGWAGGTITRTANPASASPWWTANGNAVRVHGPFIVRTN